MPTQFADLLTVSGLVGLTVLVVGLLKRIQGKEGSLIRRATDWIRKNQFLTSVAIAAAVAAIAYAIRETGSLPYAEKYWQGAIFLWTVAQALYNGQKGLANVVRGQPN